MQGPWVAHEPREANAAIGQRIAQARKRAGLSGSVLGAKLGISHAAVSDMERGKTRLDIPRLEALAGALGAQLEELLYGEGANLCRKCGGADIHLAYHRDEYKCGWGKHARQECEHLHYSCRRCGYDWTGPTKDAK